MSAEDETLEEESIDTEDRSIAAAKWLLLSPDCPPLSTTVIDSFLSIPETCPEEELKRMKKRVVEKALTSLHKKPVRKVQSSFGFYLKEVRNTAHLPAKGVAEFLGKSPSYLEKIESGKMLPWKLKTAELTDLVILFRIHYKAVRQLMLGSAAVNQGRSDIRETIRKAPRSAQKQLRSQSNEQVEAFTDEFYASLADESLMTEEIETSLKNLYEELKRRKATSFIN